MNDITELAQRARINAECGEHLSPAETMELVEALEKAQQLETLDAEMVIQISKRLAEAYKRVTELESGVKFPGVMRCNTCGFSRTHVIATPGGMRAGKSEPENCPNGCGPMWHDTYRRQYDELHDAYTALRESNTQVIQSRDHYKRMSEEGLKKLAESRTVTVKLPPKIERNDADGWFMYNGGRVGGGAAEWYNKALDDVISAQSTFVTVKLPSLNPEMFNGDVMFGYHKAQKEAVEFCAAAGIKWEAE